MTNAINNRKRYAIWLGILQIFVAIGAIPASILLITDPSGSSLGTPIELLDNSPFSDFLIPGIFLLAVNGISNLIGAAASFRLYSRAGEIAAALGTFLILWIIAQVYWMGIG
ncbi:hypothetical protein KFU94_56505 [Chloroflexi bacterium TSY]|nr:hypothetical protein [Chloroflexi bacterium TSY]